MEGHLPIAILFLVVAAATTALLVLTHRLGPRRADAVKDTSYESGEDPLGRARVRLTVPYFRAALLALLVEAFAVLLLLFGVALRGLQGTGAAIALAVFIGLLGVGYVYALRKGVLEWE